MTRILQFAASLTTVVLVAACSPGVPAPTTASRNTGYAGPLTLRPDFSDNATAEERAGAAGLALQCEGGTTADGGGGDYVDGGAEYVADSAERALEIYLRKGNFNGPDGPFVVERQELDRVLFSYRVGGRAKATMLAVKGISDWRQNTGWGIESWGACDPAEWPAEVTDELGLQVWERAGKRMPRRTITSFDGMPFCGWEKVRFVTLGEFRVGQVFVRDPAGALARLTRVPYQPTGRLPSSAINTGFEHEGRVLWRTADNSAAYLVSIDEPSDVELWPGFRELPICF